MIILDLPYPPSVNTYWRHATIKGQQRVLISEAGRKYRKAVYEAVLMAAPSQRRVAAGRLEVGIKAYMPDRRARDLDNLPKALLDSLTNAGVIADDSLIDRLVIERGPIVKGGKARVYIDAFTEIEEIDK
ncbi:RusA family crossover junction endodeoxyribonuclease [Pusillimonas noertemannii]|uniref:Crossover junction endodeoxyribonuclease RusA n=1 Tax=Pusillimonas noertemannii TaxID=305977 RepID=A0A2U1CRV3_9BURK|nr:RusA family crossover junction endodeoxyribonuclease [Pusillimonas noertemannii]NYT67957.1 RusA family crossover junction endodeoxyribonuclease [Pusillimonas noertemannii]PVY68630.1 crossover junction endodeoxyribonuclease RusA [Pusillimonas noertemannii]TFL11902.1 RusA family crossover junction endodeoxyribonuclease [Pusillimonas noertemannii]